LNWQREQPEPAPGGAGVRDAVVGSLTAIDPEGRFAGSVSCVFLLNKDEQKGRKGASSFYKLQT